MKSKVIEHFKAAIRVHCDATTTDFFGKKVPAGTESETYALCKAYEIILRLDYGFNDEEITECILYPNK